MRGQDTQKRAPRGHPREGSLQHADEQVAGIELPHDERRERPVGLELSAEQDAAGYDSSEGQNISEEPGGHVEYGDCLTRQRQHRGQTLEPFDVARYRQVAGQSP